MARLKKNYLVHKRNVLNEIRSNSMTLQELRFFSIYLSRINPQNISTRVVRFSVTDFQAIMELDSHLKIDDMKRTTSSLLSKIVNVSNERGGYEAFQLFKECRVDTDENGEWYVEIDAHDKALPLMFEYQSRFFSYQLWNALRLKSSNQLRMYEILKQYENVGYRILDIDRLKELLGISKKDYPRFGNFKIRVLDACQQALKENTDLVFTYEPYEKKGKGGKIQSLKFIISKNKDYIDQVTLSDFINNHSTYTAVIPPDGQASDENGTDFSEAYQEKIKLLAEACNDEFTFQETVVLYNDMKRCLPYSLIREDIRCFDYLNDKYQEMLMRNSQNKIAHRLGYLRSIIGKDS